MELLIRLNELDFAALILSLWKVRSGNFGLIVLVWGSNSRPLLSSKVATGSRVKHLGTILARVGSAQLTSDLRLSQFNCNCNCQLEPSLAIEQKTKNGGNEKGICTIKVFHYILFVTIFISLYHLEKTRNCYSEDNL